MIEKIPEVLDVNYLILKNKINELIDVVNKIERFIESQHGDVIRTATHIDWDEVKRKANEVCKNCGEVRGEHTGKFYLADLGCDRFEPSRT